MIYIINNNDNSIVTESWIDTIPLKILVYFDDIEVGEFDNYSSSSTYFKFDIPQNIITNLKLENMEYTMKIYKDFALFKTELITVQSTNTLDIVSPIRVTTIKMKEK